MDSTVSIGAGRVSAAPPSALSFSARLGAWALCLGTLGLGASGLVACHRGAPPGDTAAGVPTPDESAPAVQMGVYRAVLALPAGELPFGLELTRDGAATVGYLLNGKERVRLDEVAVTGG